MFKINKNVINVTIKKIYFLYLFVYTKIYSQSQKL